MLVDKIVDFTNQNYSVQKQDSFATKAERAIQSTILSTIAAVEGTLESFFLTLLSLPSRALQVLTLGKVAVFGDNFVVNASTTALSSTVEAAGNIFRSIAGGIPAKVTEIVNKPEVENTSEEPVKQLSLKERLIENFTFYKQNPRNILSDAANYMGAKANHLKDGALYYKSHPKEIFSDSKAYLGSSCHALKENTVYYGQKTANVAVSGSSYALSVAKAFPNKAKTVFENTKVVTKEAYKNDPKKFGMVGAGSATAGAVALYALGKLVQAYFSTDAPKPPMPPVGDSSNLFYSALTAGIWAAAVGFCVYEDYFGGIEFEYEKQLTPQEALGEIYELQNALEKCDIEGKNEIVNKLENFENNLKNLYLKKGEYENYSDHDINRLLNINIKNSNLLIKNTKLAIENKQKELENKALEALEEKKKLDNEHSNMMKKLDKLTPEQKKKLKQMNLNEN